MAMLVDMFGDDTVADEAEANGRLAAAAPDLLAALEDQLEYMTENASVGGVFYDDAQMIDQIRAAVAKAKGEQPTS